MKPHKLNIYIYIYIHIYSNIILFIYYFIFKDSPINFYISAVNIKKKKRKKKWLKYIYKHSTFTIPRWEHFFSTLKAIITPSFASQKSINYSILYIFEVLSQ